MNCQEARDSLSMLLDGDIGLTERVPLELHVNACDGCHRRLAHLQELKELEQRARPAPRPIHWRLVLAPGFMEKALGVMRAEDVTTRLRRLVVEKVPSRQLAVAAAVPLLVMLAVFVFERGFTVGSAMRQRPPAVPSQATSDLRVAPPVAGIAPSPPTVVTPILPAPVAPSPALATRPASPMVDPPAEKPRAAETKAAAARVPEPKAIDTKGAPRAARSDDLVKDEKAWPPAAAKPMPAKPAAAASTNSSSDSNRKVAVARAAPDAHAPVKVAESTTVPPSRRGMVDVVGRLQVKSRSDAERDLTALFASAGGTAVDRRRGPSVTVLEGGVPHANYARFSKGITRIGSWRVEAERSPLPDVVQVSVRLAE